jgi:hypothetical protein
VNFIDLLLMNKYQQKINTIPKKRIKVRMRCRCRAKASPLAGVGAGGGLVQNRQRPLLGKPTLEPLA